MKFVPDGVQDIKSSCMHHGDKANLPIEQDTCGCDGCFRRRWETRHSRYDVKTGWLTQLLQRFDNHLRRTAE